MLRKPRKPYFQVKDIHHTPKNLYMVIYNLNADKKTQGFKIWIWQTIVLGSVWVQSELAKILNSRVINQCELKYYHET